MYCEQYAVTISRSQPASTARSACKTHYASILLPTRHRECENDGGRHERGWDLVACKIKHGKDEQGRGWWEQGDETLYTDENQSRRQALPSL